ncbi:hypothetical protein BDZ85DRAFT_75161 [Elsinoe ampelina]|uniref:Uncharacterized protein n=1 Tax=Elsinoe ampelina TaxID=302913 RepID=A0A6A6GJY5_9PEZI|nr:hypothetical protein BDZ85DRAFT_75161 [Elsinoe ampelina]
MPTKIQLDGRQQLPIRTLWSRRPQYSFDYRTDQAGRRYLLHVSPGKWREYGGTPTEHSPQHDTGNVTLPALIKHGRKEKPPVDPDCGRTVESPKPIASSASGSSALVAKSKVKPGACQSRTGTVRCQTDRTTESSKRGLVIPLRGVGGRARHHCDQLFVPSVLPHETGTGTIDIHKRLGRRKPSMCPGLKRRSNCGCFSGSSALVHGT